MLTDTHKPNLLLWFLIFVSLGIHAVIFIRMAGIHRPAAPVYIELDLRTRSKPVQRKLPRPKPVALSETSATPQNFPDIPEPLPQPTRISPLPAAETEPATAPAEMHRPAIPAVKQLKIAVWKGENQKDTSQETAADTGAAAPITAAYLQEVKKIMPMIAAEADRRYKKKSRQRQIEGRTSVRVVINDAGEIVETKIAESSTYDMLDAIALKAVASASPFPRPPHAPLTIDIPINFKLK